MTFTHKFVGVLCCTMLVSGVTSAGQSSAGDSPGLKAQAAPERVLSSADRRFVGPYRGGCVIAVAGSTADHHVFHFGAANWKGRES